METGSNNNYTDSSFTHSHGSDSKRAADYADRELSDSSSSSYANCATTNQGSAHDGSSSKSIMSRGGVSGLMKKYGGGSGHHQMMCEICHKAFQGRNCKSNLERHMLIHTGHKPWRCPYCQHCCNRKANLRAHIETIHPSETVPVEVQGR